MMCPACRYNTATWQHHQLCVVVTAKPVTKRVTPVVSVPTLGTPLEDVPTLGTRCKCPECGATHVRKGQASKAQRQAAYRERKAR